jgi:hypothetical protein
MIYTIHCAECGRFIRTIVCQAWKIDKEKTEVCLMCERELREDDNQ